MFWMGIFLCTLSAVDNDSNVREMVVFIDNFLVAILESSPSSLANIFLVA